MKLKEKICIITGAASGFGKGIAKKFNEEGSIIVLADINSASLKQVAKDFNQDFFQVDVASANGMEKLSEYVLKKYEKIDIMVNNAGITHLPKPLEDVSEEEFDESFTGVVLLFEKSEEFQKGNLKTGLIPALLSRIKHSKLALSYIILTINRFFSLFNF